MKAVAAKPVAKKAAPKKPTVRKAATPARRKRMNAYERVRLMKRLADRRAVGETWASISKAEGKPIRTLQECLAEYDEIEATHDDPLGVVSETLLIYAKAIGIFAEEAANCEHPAVRVGAGRSMVDAAKGRLELLSAIGKMPRMLAAYRESADLERMFTEMGHVLEKHDADPQLIRDLLDVLGPKDQLALGGGDVIEVEYEEDAPGEAA